MDTGGKGDGEEPKMEVSVLDFGSTVLGNFVTLDENKLVVAIRDLFLNSIS